MGKELDVTDLSHTETTLPYSLAYSNFTNQLHMLSFMSEHPRLKVILVKKNGEILSIFQIDERTELKIIRVLGEPDSILIEFIKAKYDPDVIIRVFSLCEAPLTTFNEYYVKGGNIDESKFYELIPERYKKYIKAERKNENIQYLSPTNKKSEIIKEIYRFLDTWKIQTGVDPKLDRQLMDKWIETDLGHMRYLWDSKINKIVGYALFSVSNYRGTKQGTVISSHSNKVLRGYSQLGTLLKIKTLLEIKNLYPDVEIITLGTEGTSTQKSFKETFLPLGGKFEHKFELLSKKEHVEIDGTLLKMIKTMWISDFMHS